MSKDKDPNEGLADDAALATDLGDEKERSAQQLAYFGGDPIEEDEDDSPTDRGDSLDSDDDDGDRGDDVDDEQSEEEPESDEEVEETDEDADDADESSEEDGEDEAEDEEADDSDQDDSDGDEVEEEEEEDPEPKDKGIPRKRFNEVNERMKTAERRIAELENTDKAKDEAAEQKYDFDTSEKEYMDLMLDGRLDEAAAKRREIREAERAEFKAETKQETKVEINSSQVQESVDSLALQAEDMYPVLDESHADYDPKVVQKVMTFMAGYEAAGMNADDALVAGLADAIQIFDLDTKYGDTEEQDEDPKPKKKVAKKGKPIKKTKEKLAIQKKHSKSPAGEGKGSAESGAVVPDLDQMTDEEIDALPAKTLSRLRGDFMD